MKYYRKNCFSIVGEFKDLIKKDNYNYVRVMSNGCSSILKDKEKIAIESLIGKTLIFDVKACTFNDTDKIYYILEKIRAY